MTDNSCVIKTSTEFEQLVETAISLVGKVEFSGKNINQTLELFPDE